MIGIGLLQKKNARVLDAPGVAGGANRHPEFRE
jgi:hypothetical protein